MRSVGQVPVGETEAAVELRVLEGRQVRERGEHGARPQHRKSQQSQILEATHQCEHALVHRCVLVPVQVHNF